MKKGEVLWKDDLEKIGAFDTSRFYVNLSLQPQAFSEVWKAPRNDGTRIITIKFKKTDHPTIFAVTGASLSEFMFEVAGNTKGKQTTIRGNTMAARLGVVLFWFGCILSVLTLLTIPFGLMFPRGAFGGMDFFAIFLVTITASAIWLVGRACRYVLAGG